eukprot:g5291.t1
MEEELSFCPLRADNISYEDRLYNPEQHNFCPVPEKGFDAVLFVAIGVTVTCLAPRKHYAIIMLFLGACLQLLNIEFNLRELSNALNLWIGIRPARLFFYIFLPPLLLDSAVRIDFFVFKKVMVQVFVFAFMVVSINAVLLAVFMLYILDLRHHGWEWTDAFLFACMIASTDALAVSAIMKDGGGPESLTVLAEGESLFNDATSIVFFDLFWPRFKDTVAGTLKSEALGKIIGSMTLDVIRLATGGALVGYFGGYITRVIFKFLQNRSDHTPIAEVGITIGVSYFCYYTAENVLEVSGVIAVVVYGLYGAATSQWSISPEARESRVFSRFWDVTQLLTNGIVFFYAGASATNFFYRCEEDLFEDSNTHALSTILAWLPGVYIGIFLLRFLEIAAVAPVIGLLGSSRLKINEIIFISLAGLRGALALILAQELLQYEFPHDDNPDRFKQEKKVRAQSALWVCGFVLLTLVINAPGIRPLMKLCKLQESTSTQLKYRKKAHETLEKYTKHKIEAMKQENVGTICGVNWVQVKEFIFSEGKIKGRQNMVSKAKKVFHEGTQGVQHAGLALFESLVGKAPPIIPKTRLTERDQPSLDDQFREALPSEEPFSDTPPALTPALGEEAGKRTEPMIPTGGSPWDTPNHSSGNKEITNGVLLVVSLENRRELIEQTQSLPRKVQRFMENHSHPFHPKNQRFFATSSSYLNLVKANSTQLVQLDELDEHGEEKKAPVRQLSLLLKTASSKGSLTLDPSVSVPLLNPTESDHDDEDESPRSRMLAEGRFRLLMGLKKYFQQRRTEGYLSPRALRLLTWSCDNGMEKPEHPLALWDLVESDIRSRFPIKAASKIRYFLRKAAVGLKSWPDYYGTLLTPILNRISHGLSYLLTDDLAVAVEAAVECWIAHVTFRRHSHWLLDDEGVQAMETELEDQQEKVWQFILAREVEAPERFQAVQTFRAKRALLQGQICFIDTLYESGLLEESEHEHLTKDLSLKRALLQKTGPVIKTFEVLEFLRNIPFFSNVSDQVFRSLIGSCQLSMFKDQDLIPFTDSSPNSNSSHGSTGAHLETFSFHIVVNGLLKSEFQDQEGRVQEYYLGRGGVYGLLCALSGEYPPWMERAYAELNAVGQGPSILTVPHSVLQRIHAEAIKGNLQYQQLELDLFRVAALYTVRFLQTQFLHLITSFLMTQRGDIEMDGYVRTIQGGEIINNHQSTPKTELKLQEKVDRCHDQAMSLLKEVKEGLIKGDLVLIPPASSFHQTSSTVLLIGALQPQDSEGIDLRAPVMLPWMNNEDPGCVKYKSGPQGAILVTCPAAQNDSMASSSAANDNQGVRIGGSTMAPLPPSAASMMNEFIK